MANRIKILPYIFVIYSIGRVWPMIGERQADWMAARWLWPLSLFQFQTTPTYLHSLCGLALVLSLAAILRPHWIVRAAVFVFILQLFAFENSFGKVNHSTTGWIFFLGALSVPDRFLARALDVTFIYVMSCYANAGLWKLRTLATEWWQFREEASISRALLSHMAYAQAEGSLPSYELASWLSHNEWLSATAWITLIIFELSFMGAVISQRLRTPALCLAIGFHLVILGVMGISFRSQIFLLIALLLIQTNLVEMALSRMRSLVGRR